MSAMFSDIAQNKPATYLPRHCSIANTYLWPLWRQWCWQADWGDHKSWWQSLIHCSSCWTVVHQWWQWRHLHWQSGSSHHQQSLYSHWWALHCLQSWLETATEPLLTSQCWLIQPDSVPLVDLVGLQWCIMFNGESCITLKCCIYLWLFDMMPHLSTLTQLQHHILWHCHLTVRPSR